MVLGAKGFKLKYPQFFYIDNHNLKPHK